MVVVPTNSPEWISRSLDSGAQAVIVLPFLPLDMSRCNHHYVSPLGPTC